MLEPGQVELVFRVVAADAPGVGGGKNAIGADYLPGVFVPAHQVVTVGVVDVLIHAGNPGGQLGPHFLAENPVAQALGIQDFPLAFGDADGEVSGDGLGRLLLKRGLLIAHIFYPCRYHGDKR